jgi:RNA ligase (TIGR02306 family)
MRKLATIQRVKDIRPIDGADAIELVFIHGWQVVSKKGEHKVGDLVVYLEIDSFLPIREEFEFLRKSSYKKMGELEGFRLRTIKLRGQLSQGLVLPLSALDGKDEMVLEEGVDVSDVLGIFKYEPPVPAQLSGKVRGNFPSFIPKTDEERVQNLTNILEVLTGKSMYVTEKLDGSSATFYLVDNRFGVCSRNLDLTESDDNAFWQAARELDIENKLRSLGFNVSIQGELIGEGIQGNKYKLKGKTVRFFNVFNIDEQKYAGYEEFKQTMDKLQLLTVPILSDNYILPANAAEILSHAEGKSELNREVDREGIVIRSHDRTISFKAISNTFLLAEK